MTYEYMSVRRKLGRLGRIARDVGGFIFPPLPYFFGGKGGQGGPEIVFTRLRNAGADLALGISPRYQP
jgi:hypothetical protein